MIELKRKILSIVLVTTLILTAMSFMGMVNGAKPEDIVFGVPFYSFGVSSSDIRQAGISDNWIEHANTFGDLIGDIEGTMTAESHWIFHDWVGPETDPGHLEIGQTNGGAILTIEGVTLWGSQISGTITLKFVTRSNEFGGTWVILGGTEDLKGITGQGTWSGFGLIDSIPSQVFEGNIHF